jgi:hypothetical protein
MKLNILKFSAAALAAGSLLLQGCATPASSTAMAVKSSDTVATQSNPKLQSAMQVRNVSGGKETNPLWVSQVDSAGFRSALEQSVRAMGYSSPSTKNVKYFIDAELQALSQPMFGFTYDVTSTVRYTVEGNDFRKIYPITATGTATTSDAFIGAERLRLANEKSINANIKQFIVELNSSIGN